MQDYIHAVFVNVSKRDKALPHEGEASNATDNPNYVGAHEG